MFIKRLSQVLTALWLLGAFVTPVNAQPKSVSVEPVITAPPNTPIDAMVVTHGQIMSAGKLLKYTVHAGTLPIYDNDTGRLAARMFVTAYTADRPKTATPRPITFIWNGGPGSSSSQMHLIGFAPKGFKMAATYPQWKGQPSEIEDRPETWLTASDLVFVDPIGTGYSRAVSDEWRDRLYTQFGDAEAVAEMIRVYRTRFEAFDAPIFLAGESYGTVRAMEVSADLARRRTPVAGVILISHLYYAGEPLAAPLKEAMQVPLFTATAWYHKRLAPDLQTLSQADALNRASAWARADYAAALSKRETLTPDERAKVMQGLVRYTGLSPRYVNQKTLTISKDTFTDHLLDDEGLELGRYDAREALPLRKTGRQWGPRQDPSLLPMVDLMEGTSPPLIHYLRDTLGYKSDLLYRGPWGNSFHPDPMDLNPAGGAPAGYADDWMAVIWEHQGKTAEQAKDGGDPHEVSAFRQALEAEPKMLVWNVSGLYDQSCAERDEALARADAAVKARVRNSCYAAGHMVYTDVAIRQAMQRDFTRFVQDGVVSQRSGDAR